MEIGSRLRVGGPELDGWGGRGWLKGGSGAARKRATPVRAERLLPEKCWKELAKAIDGVADLSGVWTAFKAWAHDHKRHGPPLDPPLPPRLARVMPDLRFLAALAAGFKATEGKNLSIDECRAWVDLLDGLPDGVAGSDLAGRLRDVGDLRRGAAHG